MKIHIVKKGDTLYDLAKKYHVELDALIAMNQQLADPNQLDIGMKIKIPSSAPAVPTAPPNTYPHMVKQGDTLWKLSKATGVPLQAMIDANPQLKNPNVLMTGQIIYIPTQGGMHHEHGGMHHEHGGGMGGMPGMGHGKVYNAPMPVAPAAPMPVAPMPVPQAPIVPAAPEAPIVAEEETVVMPQPQIVIEKEVPQTTDITFNSEHLFMQFDVPAVPVQAPMPVMPVQAPFQHLPVCGPMPSGVFPYQAEEPIPTTLPAQTLPAQTLPAQTLPAQTLPAQADCGCGGSKALPLPYAMQTPPLAGMPPLISPYGTGPAYLHGHDCGCGCKGGKFPPVATPYGMTAQSYPATQMPDPLPGGMMGTMPGGMTGTMPGGMTGTMPGGMMGTIPDGMMDTMPGGMMGTMPGGMMGTMPGGMMGTMPDGMMGTMPDGMMGTMPGSMMGTMPDGMIGTMPGSMMGTMPGSMMGTMPDGMMGSMPTGRPSEALYDPRTGVPNPDAAQYVFVQEGFRMPVYPQGGIPANELHNYPEIEQRVNWMYQQGYRPEFGSTAGFEQQQQPTYYSTVQSAPPYAIPIEASEEKAFTAELKQPAQAQPSGKTRGQKTSGSESLQSFLHKQSKQRPRREPARSSSPWING
ncbi:MAG: LysM peptidoglycan-binding domain-containing protein [Paenibacillaceae bacterium]|nr:LysM peptidoglycan-binding domain-containing protein [Paenibacillaceae bacterium]